MDVGGASGSALRPRHDSCCPVPRPYREDPMDLPTGWKTGTLVALALAASASTAAAQDTLRVASYNIRMASGGGNRSIFGKELMPFPNRPRKPLKQIAAVLVETGADLVGLQEVQARTIRSWGANQTAYIADRMGGFDSAAGFGREKWKGILDKNGNSLVTRWELENVKDIRLTDEDFHGSPRLVIAAQVELPGGAKVWFANTHLSAYEGREARLLQIDLLEAALAELEGPMILVGDFNARPDTPEMERLLAAGFAGRHFRDAAAEAGAEENTYPSSGGTRRIDYILVSEEFDVLGSRVVDAGDHLSDHMPVVAELRYAPGLAAVAAAPAPAPPPGLFGIPSGE